MKTVDRRLRRISDDSPVPADSLRERVAAERDRLYGSLLLRAAPGKVAFVLLAGFVVHDHVSLAGLLAAGVVMLAVLGGHLHLARRMARSVPATHSGRDVFYASLLSVAAALAAGAAAGYWFAGIPPGTRLAITVVLIGAYAVSIACDYARPATLLAVGVCLLGPLAASWILHGERGGLLIGVSLVLLALLAWYVSVFASGAAEEAIRSRLRESDLSRSLELRTRELESAIRAKSQFLAAASHDLRQPVTSMNLLLGRFEGESAGADVRELAAQVRPSVDAMGMILGSMLEMSRLEAGLIKASSRAFDVRALLLAIQIEYTPRASMRGLEIRTDAAPLVVHGDPDLLSRVVRNLVDNSHKFTKQGYIELGGRQDGEHCVISVRDTGIGIPAAIHERVFDDYFQAQNTHRDRTQGLGLGLAIVRRLVALLEGTVAITPVEGPGTRIEVRIPMRSKTGPAPSERKLPVTLEEALAGKQRLLVVDDDPLIRDALGKLVAGSRIATRFAQSAAEAAVIAGRDGFAPDTVIADHRLPGMSGIELVEALVRASPTIAAVVITGDLDPLLEGRAAVVGAVLLSKPFDAAQLAGAIASARDRAANRTADRRPSPATNPASAAPRSG